MYSTEHFPHNVVSAASDSANERDHDSLRELICFPHLVYFSPKPQQKHYFDLAKHISYHAVVSFCQISLC